MLGPEAGELLSTGKAILVSMRPRQWVKNVFLFAGLIFSGNLLAFSLVLLAWAGFVAFCLLSGGVYLLNDVWDYERDRHHPVKRHRPIASGQLDRRLALAAGVVILAAGLALSFRLLSGGFWALAGAYVALQVCYTLLLKHLIILDVMAVALGFVLRAVAGVVAIRVEVSSWFFISVLFLSIFLALGKRRHELRALGGQAAGHRMSLIEYNAGLLDQMTAAATASTITTYALYTMSTETISRLKTPWLPLTLPFVVYGVFRYLYLLYRHDLGGDPSEILLTDGPLLVNGLIWGVSVVAIIYFLR